MQNKSQKEKEHVKAPFKQIDKHLWNKTIGITIARIKIPPKQLARRVGISFQTWESEDRPVDVALFEYEGEVVLGLSSYSDKFEGIEILLSTKLMDLEDFYLEKLIDFFDLNSQEILLRDRY